MTDTIDTADASIAKFVSGEPEELTQLRVEAMRMRIELLKCEHRDAEAHATQSEIETKELVRRYDDFCAGDNFNRLYRFTDDINERSVAHCMDTLSRWARLSQDPIEVVFFSPGGNIIEGMALFDFLQGLRARGIKITTGASGMAASMAGILLQAGDHRWAGEQSWILIHRPSTGAIGKVFDIEDTVEFTHRLEERCVNILTSRSNLESSQIEEKWRRKDWWLTSEEALEHGLIDEITNKLVV